MNKEVKNSILKSVGFGVGVCIISIILAVIIRNIKKYTFIDVLFLEGIILIIIGALSCVGGSSTGVVFKPGNSTNAQFSITDNKGKSKYERDRNHIRKILPLSILKVSIIIGGILDCILTFVI
jgi:hypothetical protein